MHNGALSCGEFVIHLKNPIIVGLTQLVNALSVFTRESIWRNICVKCRANENTSAQAQISLSRKLFRVTLADFNCHAIKSNNHTHSKDVQLLCERALSPLCSLAQANCRSM